MNLIYLYLSKHTPNYCSLSFLCLLFILSTLWEHKKGSVSLSRRRRILNSEKNGGFIQFDSWNCHGNLTSKGYFLYFFNSFNLLLMGTCNLLLHNSILILLTNALFLVLFAVSLFFVLFFFLFFLNFFHIHPAFCVFITTRKTNFFYSSRNYERFFFFAV